MLRCQEAPAFVKVECSIFRPFTRDVWIGIAVTFLVAMILTGIFSRATLPKRDPSRAMLNVYKATLNQSFVLNAR